MAQLLNKRLEAQHTNAVGFFGWKWLLTVRNCACIRYFVSPTFLFFPSDVVIMNANASRQER